ncbi:hypothetical protein Aph01nite_07780 [Acrocarpospora phusangensis]|uniref:Uncharacterized protein n=1 Tax=Acrocarpospora phusangensis TaxID=1070424 RepID=A0A919Q7R5_9ACTN|nr:hypothetical protein Aph01nite_07780 [Acrocarpospora phusangensis]
MTVSKRTTFTVMCAAVLSAVLPGFAGYASAKFEAYDQAKKELARLRADLREARSDGRILYSKRDDPAIAGDFSTVPGVDGRGNCGSVLWPGR